MEYNELILQELKKISETNSKLLEAMMNLLRLMSKYDSQYMEEMEREGHKSPQP